MKKFKLSLLILIFSPLISFGDDYNYQPRATQSSMEAYRNNGGEVDRPSIDNQQNVSLSRMHQNQQVDYIQKNQQLEPSNIEPGRNSMEEYRNNGGMNNDGINNSVSPNNNIYSNKYNNQQNINAQ